MVVNGPEGLIVISGCAHAGIVNTVEDARKVIREAPIDAAIGGFHLFALTDDQWNGPPLACVPPACVSSSAPIAPG